MKELNRIIKELNRIIKELKAPKNQYNLFGKYKYRSCEDILEGLKKVIGNNIINVSDEIVVIGDRYYVKATASFYEGGCLEKCVSSTAYAREDDFKKGMDGAQVTGCASSYARKYALNGLFCIDDTKDSDRKDNNNTKKEKNNCPVPQEQSEQIEYDDIPSKPIEWGFWTPKQRAEYNRDNKTTWR
jgi:hypothetical protein